MYKEPTQQKKCFGLLKQYYGPNVPKFLNLKKFPKTKKVSKQ